MDAGQKQLADARAQRFHRFGETVFAEMSRLAIEHDAINLGQGFPNFSGPDFIIDAAEKAMRAGHNQYPPTIGIPELNARIAAFFERSSGIAVDPRTEVTVTSGCTEALAATFLGLINPGDEVILFEPYYDCYLADVIMAGATPRFVTLNAPSFDFKEEDLRSAFGERTRAILVNTPHNPTGKVFSESQMRLIAELCQQHDVLAITDEVYERLVYDGEHIQMAALTGMRDRTVTLSSLGKTFSFTGWKVGWAIAPPHLTHGIRSAHQFLTFTTPPPLQYGAAAALDAPESYYAELTSTFRRRRDMLADGLSEIGFVVHRPAAGYFIMADHTPFGFDDDIAFSRHLVEQVGVAAIPPGSFYEHPQHGASMTRFAFCKDDALLQEGLRRLRRLAG